MCMGQFHGCLCNAFGMGIAVRVAHGFGGLIQIIPFCDQILSDSFRSQTVQSFADGILIKRFDGLSCFGCFANVQAAVIRGCLFQQSDPYVMSDSAFLIHTEPDIPETMCPAVLTDVLHLTLTDRIKR